MRELSLGGDEKDKSCKFRLGIVTYNIAANWDLVRRAPGRYDLRQIIAPSSKPLVATRSIRVSPFPREGDALYFAGYDANKVPAHDTAWIFRATFAAVLGAAR